MNPIDLLEAPRPDQLPATAEEWLRDLRGPTAIRLPGRDRGRTRVLATLLHGNEPSGLRAVHAALRDGETPAADVLFFIGAVEAARTEPLFSHRQLPGGRDLNRCFVPPFAGLEGRIAEAALALVREARPEAVLDLHNNTGKNPAYGLGARLDAGCLSLCTLFAPCYIHSPLKLGTFTEALDPLAPAVTIECGQAGDPVADANALAGLLRYLRADRFEPVVASAERISVLVDPVRVELRQGISVAFADARAPGASVTLHAHLDQHNFQLLPAGTPLGWVHEAAGWPLDARDESGDEVSRLHFAVTEDLRLVTARTFVPIMITTNPDVAASDCLFYAVRPWE